MTQNKKNHSSDNNNSLQNLRMIRDTGMVGIAWTIKQWIISTTQKTTSYPKSLEEKTITYDFGIISPVLGQAQQEWDEEEFEDTNGESVNRRTDNTVVKLKRTNKQRSTKHYTEN